MKSDCPQLFYERPTEAGQTYPTLMLWDGANHLPLGADSGSFQIQTTNLQVVDAGLHRKARDRRVQVVDGDGDVVDFSE